MKLKNKRTGEIVEAHEIDLIDKYVYLKIFRAGDYDTKQYNSLTELNEEWEDYEEPKPQVVYYIDRDGEIVPYRNIEYPKRIFNAEQNKEIGNYFDTREEAELAVRKLKAWKQLKDKGFRFIDWELDMKTIADGKIWFDVGVNTQWDAAQLLDREPEVKKSLDLLFGGEE